METIILQNEGKTQTLTEFINLEYLPSVKEQLTQNHSYLQGELRSFQDIENKCSDLTFKLMDRKNEWNKNYKQLSEKNQKETDLQKRVDEYKKAKKRELVEKQKTIDALSSAMKEACSHVKPDQISKLKMNENLKSVFSGLSLVLYDIPQEKFEWEDFKKKVLLFEKGEDFQSRLANFNFRGVPKVKSDILLQIQNDSEFEKQVEDPKLTTALLDLSEWVTFAVNGIKFSSEKEELEKEYEKISKDFETRGRELQNTAKGQAFWEQSLKYVDNQVGFLDNLNSLIKGIQSNMNNSKSNLEEYVHYFVKQSEDISSIMQVPNL